MTHAVESRAAGLTSGENATIRDALKWLDASFPHLAINGETALAWTAAIADSDPDWSTHLAAAVRSVAAEHTGPTPSIALVVERIRSSAQRARRDADTAARLAEASTPDQTGRVIDRVRRALDARVPTPAGVAVEMFGRLVDQWPELLPETADWVREFTTMDRDVLDEVTSRSTWTTAPDRATFRRGYLAALDRRSIAAAQNRLVAASTAPADPAATLDESTPNGRNQP